MKIEVKKGVYWDTEATTQSDKAYAWMREQNLGRMAMAPTSDSNMVAPELDLNRRPIKWVIEHETCIVEIVREYVQPIGPSWAMKKDHITVTSKLQ